MYSTILDIKNPFLIW